MSRNGGMGAGDYARLQNSRKSTNWTGVGLVVLGLSGTFLAADTQTDFFRDTWQRVTGSPTKSVPYIYRIGAAIERNANYAIQALK